MGATGWTYSVPYQPDIGAALQSLREKAFGEGNYYKPWEINKKFLEELESKPQNQLSDSEKECLRILRDIPLIDPPDPLPATIDELLKHNAESGTHSVMDIFGLSDKADFGKAAPVPEEILLACFGTSQPTREQADHYPESFIKFIESIERWKAFYFIVYKDGQPDEIVFEGCSGD